MSPKDADEFFRRLAAERPDPKTELDYIKPIGLYRTKAKNVVELSRQLIAKHGGQVPRTREALEALPGVGRKTANVVLNSAFGEPTIAVDTHAFRVANRTGLAPGNTPLLVEQGLDRIVPDKWKHGAHHWLILHGRYVCVARKPHCEVCVVNDLCAYPAKTTLAAPAPAPRARKAVATAKAKTAKKKRARAR